MDKTITLQEVTQQWLKAKKSLVKHSTYCVYTLIAHTHLLPVFGECTEIEESTVQKFVIDKISSGLSRKSVKDILATLKAIVKFGVKHNSFPHIPWEISFPTDTEHKPLPVLSLTDHRRLMRYLLEGPCPQNIGVLLSLCTGMRIGEVCALKWSDVDLTRHIITVGQTIGRIYNIESKTTERIITSPKTRTSNREIPICKELMTAMRRVKKTTKDSVFVVGNGTNPKEPRIYRDFFSRLLKRLGIPKIVFHGLRHTFATRCIECLCDYKTVSVILGHSNVSTTLNLYVHPNLDQKKRCMDRMSKFMGVL